MKKSDEQYPQLMSRREVAAVIAALRMAQGCQAYAQFSVMPHFKDEGLDPLWLHEIDELCERLNQVIPSRKEKQI
jgi:hypothetical protein